MTIKKLPVQFPAISFRTFQSFDEGSQVFRGTIGSIEEMRKRLYEVVNANADVSTSQETSIADHETRITANEASIAALEASTFGINRIINGTAPFVNQRGNQVGLTNGEYFADRWQWRFSGTAVVDGSVSSSGGDDWIQIDVTTTDTSIADDDVYAISQLIEGNLIYDFKLGTADAATVTLSFKHKHIKAGIYCISFQNSATDRSYVAEYTQAIGDTEEESIITVMLDTSGTWLDGISLGLQMIWTAAAGSTFQAAAGSWQVGNFYATSNQVNALDAVGNKMRIRDVQLELGSAATKIHPRPFPVELMLCKRYFEIMNVLASTSAWTATTNAYTWTTEKRTVPTLVVESIVLGSGANYATLDDENTFYQSAANSDATLATVHGDAEL